MDGVALRMTEDSSIVAKATAGNQRFCLFTWWWIKLLPLRARICHSALLQAAK